MNKNNKKIISITILVFLIIFGVLFFLAHKTNKENLHSSNLPPTKVEEQGANQATLNINGVIYEGEITEKTSVYDFMSELQTTGKINFTEKNYIGMGEFINGINGIKNNNSQSWIYYVNGKEAQVGVSNYKINGGDVVSWKYEKSDY